MIAGFIGGALVFALLGLIVLAAREVPDKPAGGERPGRDEQWADFHKTVPNIRKAAVTEAALELAFHPVSLDTPTETTRSEAPQPEKETQQPWINWKLSPLWAKPVRRSRTTSTTAWKESSGSRSPSPTRTVRSSWWRRSSHASTSPTRTAATTGRHRRSAGA